MCVDSLTWLKNPYWHVRVGGAGGEGKRGEGGQWVDGCHHHGDHESHSRGSEWLRVDNFTWLKNPRWLVIVGCGGAGEGRWGNGVHNLPNIQIRRDGIDSYVHCPLKVRMDQDRVHWQVHACGIFEKVRPIGSGSGPFKQYPWRPHGVRFCWWGF